MRDQLDILETQEMQSVGESAVRRLRVVLKAGDRRTMFWTSC
jgi:hypothetical protein